MAEKRFLAFTSNGLMSGKAKRRGGRKAQPRTRKLVEKKIGKRIEKPIVLVGASGAASRKH